MTLIMQEQRSMTVIGAGSWGTALAILAARNGHNVTLWGHDAAHIAQMEIECVNAKYLPKAPFPSTLKVTPELAIAVNASQGIILLAIPSQAFCETLVALKPHLKSHHGLVIATKGLDPTSGEFLIDTLFAVLGASVSAGILSGPTFAAEIATGQPSAITLASFSNPLVEQVLALLYNTYFRIYRTSDIKGVSIGGAVKNVLAIATGIAQGLGFGENTQSALITRGLAEMVRLGLALGARLETFLGLAGVGDLILTATSNQSRNRRFGLLLGQGMEVTAAEQAIHQVVEGAHNATQVCWLADKHHVEMPITRAVHRVIQGELLAREAVNELLMRTPKEEAL